MRGPLPPLAALEAFEAAARLESFAKAAAELHLSPSAISHRIRTLEAHLGERLFQRLAHGVRLSDRGKAYLPIVEAAFDQLGEGTAGLFEGRGGGKVAVRVPVSYGTLFLAPRLPGFTAREGTRVELLSAIWAGDAADVEVDFEVRFGPPPRTAHMISAEHAVLIANAPFGSSPLTAVRVVGYDDLWNALDPVTLASIGDDRPLQAVDTWAGAVALIRHNPGYCAIVPSLVAVDAADDGAVSVVADVGLASSYWIEVHNADAMHRPERLAFLTWLATEHEVARNGPSLVGPGSSSLGSD